MSNSKLIKSPRKPKIFIAYQITEIGLADALSELFQFWGYDAFHCRTEGRDAEQYRKDLRERLLSSDLCVFILSREFQWSAYCQAEVGTVMAVEMPFVAIFVPPITPQSVRDVAPVLEGMDVMSVQAPTFIYHLETELRTRLEESAPRRLLLTKRLNHSGRPPAILTPEAGSTKLEKLRTDVSSAIDAVTQRYRYQQPGKSLLTRWESLRDEACQESIIRNLSNSMMSQTPETTVDLAGPSLKYSLSLLDRAIEAVHSKGFKATWPKSLRLRLVHMDADSHILHALGDDADVEHIRSNFSRQWLSLNEKWCSICARANIAFVTPVVQAIDYIPPVIGILIDNTVLYRGQCTFSQIGLGSPPSFRLDAGENEYDMWVCDDQTERSFPAYKARAAFKGSFAAYLTGKFNSGVMVVQDSSIWLSRLAEHLNLAITPLEVTMVSSTAVRFEPLIRLACKKGLSVRVLLHASQKGASKTIKQVMDRYSKELGPVSRYMKVECFSRPTPFRGIAIGDRIIGLQPYTNIDEKQEKNSRIPNLKLPACFLVTPNCPQFHSIKRSIEQLAGI